MDKPLTKSRGGLVAALDVGTTKVCCFIARLDAEAGIRMAGVGYHAADGMRGGAIIDMEAVETSILAAVHGAETMAGEHIREVFVNVSGGRPCSRTLGAEITVAGNEVSHQDVRRVLDEGRLSANGVERAILHSIPVGYRVDARRGIRDPRGMFGERLGVDIHTVTAETAAVRNLDTCLAGCRLGVRAHVLSAYASGAACLVEDEMRLGVILIDMGGGVTSVAGFADGEMVFSDSVPIGGGHVTNDIALGLNTPIHDAERLKVQYGRALPSPNDEQQVIQVPIMGGEEDGETCAVPRAELVRIVQPRLEEILERVRERIEASGIPDSPGRTVVLTGGASQLRDVQALAAPVLDRQVRLGRPRRITGLAEAVSGPAFATCAGLLQYAAYRYTGDPCWDSGPRSDAGRLLNRAGDWLREFF